MTNLQEILTPIWERVLDRSPIASQDNFFDLGGDSSLALKLFAEISTVCGQEISPVIIYQAPTIAALAAVMEQPNSARFPALTELKKGTEAPPIFVTHGIGGNIMDFFQVVKYIDTLQPIYGMQSKGVDGIEEPFERIEDMAQYFMEAIRERQPHGPYYLVGYSLGGLVMLELAQRLLAAGENVGLLAMLETYPHPRYVPLRENLRLIVLRAKRHARILVRLPIRRALSYILHPAERVAFVPRNKDSRRAGLPLDAWFPPATQRMRDRAYLALKNYKPRVYPGSIKFIRAETVTEFPEDPRAVWGELAKEFGVLTVPGDHLEIMNMYFENTGAALTRYLRETLDVAGATRLAAGLR